jgi:hypothetical protein
MGPLAMMAIGAALGAAKSELSDRPKAEKQRKLEAEKARYSGWTGMQPGAVQEADLFGNALSGGLTGASMAQGMQNQDAWNSFLQGQSGGGAAQGTSPYYFMQNGNQGMSQNPGTGMMRSYGN